MFREATRRQVVARMSNQYDARHLRDDLEGLTEVPWLRLAILPAHLARGWLHLCAKTSCLRHVMLDVSRLDLMNPNRAAAARGDGRPRVAAAIAAADAERELLQLAHLLELQPQRLRLALAVLPRALERLAQLLLLLLLRPAAA